MTPFTISFIRGDTKAVSCRLRMGGEAVSLKGWRVCLKICCSGLTLPAAIAGEVATFTIDRATSEAIAPGCHNCFIIYEHGLTRIQHPGIIRAAEGGAE